MQVWMLEESFLYLTTWGDYGLEINGRSFEGWMGGEDDEYNIYDRAWIEDVAMMEDEDTDQLWLDESRYRDSMSQAETVVDHVESEEDEVWFHEFEVVS
jgi:hypothetical protein